MNEAALSTGEQPPPPQLRLAVAFTGGVSLAVWMGGMAREMNLLLAASRIRRGETVADTTEQGRRVRDGYAALLDVLDVDVSMDVLSGTSAGGINAVILGLANVQRLDLDGLRELWFAEGSLGGLLRSPADKQAPSLLYGDKSLLAGLRTGLARLAGPEPGNPAAAQDPTRVFITTTLLAGAASGFTDGYGTLVRDIDHHGLFTFSSAELTPGNVPALALAARCSASFPVAFEPGLIPIGARRRGRPPRHGRVQQRAGHPVRRGRRAAGQPAARPGPAGGVRPARRPRRAPGARVRGADGRRARADPGQADPGRHAGPAARTGRGHDRDDVADHLRRSGRHHRAQPAGPVGERRPAAARRAGHPDGPARRPVLCHVPGPPGGPHRADRVQRGDEAGHVRSPGGGRPPGRVRRGRGAHRGGRGQRGARRAARRAAGYRRLRRDERGGPGGAR